MVFHRRIDVSPSAFKKHSHLFEDFEESGYKVTQSVFKSEIPAQMCVPAETAEMCYEVYNANAHEPQSQSCITEHYALTVQHLSYD